jgi:hypothetical protein
MENCFAGMQRKNNLKETAASAIYVILKGIWRGGLVSFYQCKYEKRAMTKEEFFKILKSNEVSEIRRVLESGYTPTSPEEIKVLSERAIVANRIFQQQVLQMAIRTSAKLSIPLLGELARKSIDPSIREKALDRLLECNRRRAKRAILACTTDEALQIQEKAIKSLIGWNDPEVIQLLIDRVMHPKSALLPAQVEQAENVRKWAIEALATEQATQAIQPLVKLMLEHEEHRQVIIKTLGIIGGREVVEGFLEVAEGKCEDAPQPDQEFKLETVRVIGSMGLKRFAHGQLERYRMLLGEVYPAALTNVSQFAYVLEETAKHLDDQLLEEVLEGFKTNLETEIAVQIVNSMRYCDLKKAELFWLDVFEHWHPIFQNVAKKVFLELAQKHQSQVIPFFRKAVRSGGSKNKQDRLPDITKGLSSEMGILVVESLAPMLDKEHPPGLLQPYFESVWTGLPTEKRHEIVRALVRPSYKTGEAMDQVATFLAPHWMQVAEEGEPAKLVVDVLREEWRRRGQKQRVEAIISHLTQHIDDTQTWCSELASRASKDPKGEEWPFFEKAFEGLPNGEQVQAIQETMNQRWHRKLAERLFELDKSQAAVVLREHLSRKGDDRLIDEDRVWALSALGEIGEIDDFELLGNEIEGESEACAVAAVKAIRTIDTNAGQERLRESLQSRKPTVVVAAIGALEGISDLQPNTIRALLERAGSEEKDEEVRKRAQAVVESLRSRHLESRPDPEEEVQNLQVWLTTLEAFGQGEDSGKALEEFLKDLGIREASEIRKALAKSVGICCPPDMGIRIAEAEADSERRGEVRAEWEDIVDRLKGLPDRGVFHLIERVCVQKLDHTGLLGKLGLEEIFQKPTATLQGLSTQLRIAEQVKDHPDSLVTILDGAAELLIDELLWADGDKPERFDQYGNKIGRSTKINTTAARHAQNLHALRGNAIGPHAKDSTGALRKGVTPQDAEESRKSFVGLFQEVVKFLLGKKEESV